jgi:hypothetical protein
MPDICMCEGGECPKRQECYRFKAKPDEYLQSYFLEPPYNRETGECEYFWQIEPKRRLTQKT